MVALGGWGHYWGPVLGAAIFTLVPELLHKFQDAELLVFGIGMILVLLYLPGGVAGLAERFAGRRRASPISNVAAATRDPR